MTLTTTEVPTFFGPSDSRLFGDFLGLGDSAFAQDRDDAVAFTPVVARLAGT
jgi:hypothetical protein